MDRKRTALTVAAAGTATGVVGLILLATPAGAGEQPPALPEISPEALVESVITTKIPAMSGAVEFSSDLGLPIPGLPQARTGGEAAHVYTDGEGRARVSISESGAERTIVRDGTTTWIWNSADRSVQKLTDGEHETKTPETTLADPATAARDFIALMGKDSTITVDGTARVADRPVYQLVLTPKPTERTLLREVRVAVDSETRLPLRLEVLANGQAEPAVRIGFTDFETGAQDASLFTYTPPAGAKVTESKPGDHKPSEAEMKEHEDLFASLDGKTVGEGWDTVLVGKVPAGLLSGEVKTGDRGTTDPTQLLKQFGKEVTGPFGTGYVISSKVGTLLVTTDGRAALGAVPQQVLVDALGAK
jgi:outer membrane lipoprotein-sorting protein